VLSGVECLCLCEVYAAGEAPIAGADGRSLSRAIRLRGATDPLFVNEPDELPELLTGIVRDGDILLVSGAGSIGRIVSTLASGALRIISNGQR